MLGNILLWILFIMFSAVIGGYIFSGGVYLAIVANQESQTPKKGKIIAIALLVLTTVITILFVYLTFQITVNSSFAEAYREAEINKFEQETING